MVVFGEDWGGLPSSTQYLVKQLVENRRVLWVNSIGLRQPTFQVRDLKRVWTKLTRKTPSQSKSEALPENLTVLSVVTIPAPRVKWARWLAKVMLKKQINQKLTEMGVEDFIFWTSLPTAVDLLGELGEAGEQKSVYYCGDDFSALAGVDHATVELREQELIKRADLIVTASDELSHRLHTERTRTLNHGVSFDLFAKPVSRANDLPDNGKPIAGFYGSISEWLNQDLLAMVISQLPDWDFVFIGKAVVDTKKIEKFKNVYFLGAKPHSELPSYSQHWQVSMLPFLQNSQIQACNPLKLREYLAAGTPIVSTPFPALIPYIQYVHQIETADEMVVALRTALVDDNRLSMKESVRNESWKAKADLLAKWIEAL